MQQSRSPKDHTISPRRSSFDLRAALARDWHGDSAFRTAWFNALSMMVPYGERFFIDSVNEFLDEIDDPRLTSEVHAFLVQEANHLRQHRAVNKLLCDVRGYDMQAIEGPILRRAEWTRRKVPAIRRLAGTAANEHLTAVLVADMLRHDDLFRDADPGMAELWYWHGVEEIEHKSVAFDVYQAAGGSLKDRRLVQIFGTIFFLSGTFRILCLMLKHDGKLWSLHEWASGFKFLFVKPGLLRRAFVPYFRFLRKDFHPWQDDDRYLIDEWEAKRQSV
ncbi:MAG: metal-dependent hydrolase [Woeseiaceae bacterium]|nr:metal-dependent hydrolase [Woeseiaceae bacterium]